MAHFACKEISNPMDVDAQYSENSRNTYINSQKSTFNNTHSVKKFAATHFPATFLKIGAFQFKPKRQGDLEARCHYSRKKFMWDMLDDTKFIKYRIEIQWDNISAIQATMEENKPGILQIELSKPPTFSHEATPTSRKWNSAKDFTNENASKFRHFVMFSPGVLDKYYENVLRGDKRLLELSQLPFPRLIMSPCFDSNPSSNRSFMNSSHVHVVHGTSPTNSIRNHRPPLLTSPQHAVAQPMQSSSGLKNIHFTANQRVLNRSLGFGMDDINVSDYNVDECFFVGADETLSDEGDYETYADMIRKIDHDFEMFERTINSSTTFPAVVHERRNY
ncbi:hypothetical protein RJT34_13663 [Clitoria ternatea]|uniref:TRF2/HOY1 PH-like domain-containing protein n=1 Tax=Clitoria ternatea TaxID=43366 RepID=A0AAN9JRY4_CLITE